MDRPLEDVVRTAGAELEDVALAIAAEFSTVDAAAHARLDVLARSLGGIAELDPEARPEALVDELDRRQGFECTWRGGPESLLLDRVLEEDGGIRCRW